MKVFGGRYFMFAKAVALPCTIGLTSRESVLHDPDTCSSVVTSIS